MASRSLTLSAWAARRRPDEDIFARTLRGDPVAFSEVYRRYQKRVYGFCLARSLDPGAAADATQEVFMRLLRAEPGSIDTPRAWLFAVARNVVIDVVRKRSRTPEDVGVDEGSLAWDRLKAADTADEVLARSDARNVFLALRSLRPRYRIALIMREIHGESAKDMADSLETTPGAIDTLVSRARDAFGAAYSSVGDLPSACRASIELVYRNQGTGITAEEQSALQVHVASCERCAAEAKKAEDPRHLGALLPFLIPANRLGHGLIERAAMTLRAVPDAAMLQAPTLLSQPHTWALGQKIAVGIAAAAIISAPIAVTTMKSSHSPRSTPVSAARQPVTSALGHGSAGGAAASAKSDPQRAAMGASAARSHAWNATVSGSLMRGGSRAGTAGHAASHASPSSKTASAQPTMSSGHNAAGTHASTSAQHSSGGASGSGSSSTMHGGDGGSSMSGGSGR